MTYQKVKGKRSVRDEDGELIEPKIADVFNLWADPDAVVRRDAYLTEDVTQAELTKYPEHQLINRLSYYERQYTFEQSPFRRAEFLGEVERTQIELARRRMYARKEAERVFAL